MTTRGEGNKRPQASSIGLVIRQKEPKVLETPVDRVDFFLTPTELFYVRSHSPAPILEMASYRLHIDGAPKEGAIPLGPIFYARSLPRAKALHREVLIAYQMNGRDLSQDHGSQYGRLYRVITQWLPSSG